MICVECGSHMSQNHKILPLVHYGHSVYAVKSVREMPCNNCSNSYQAWTAMGRLSDLADTNSERPLFAEFDFDTRTWNKIRPNKLASDLLEASDPQIIHRLCIEAIATWDQSIIPILLERSKTPNDYNDTLLLTIWMLCLSTDVHRTGQEIDPSAALIMSGHWRHLVDMAKMGDRISYFSCKILEIVGLPRTLHYELEGIEDVSVQQLMMRSRPSPDAKNAE